MHPDAPTLADPERQLALAYAPAVRRAALAWLWALDEQFAGMVAAAREPTLALLRLTWWRDALVKLDEAPAPAQPLLQALSATVLPLGVAGAALAEMEEGWSALVEEGEREEAWRHHAEARGQRLFALSGALLGREDVAVSAAGRGWALADRAASVASAEDRHALYGLASEALVPLAGHRWPRPLRPLGVLAVLAAADARACAPAPRGSPWRVARALALGLTGR